MPPLSWNEIKHRAIQFSRDWANEEREHAEAKSFWDAFFKVFGIERRVIASFEEPVRNLDGKFSYIDLFWKGTLLVEHKSRGKSLTKAQSQAMDYVQLLHNDGRQSEIPRYVLLSDFANFALHDLESGRSTKFLLEDLHRNVHELAFIPGYKQQIIMEEAPVTAKNLEGTELMGALHDALEENGYTGHALEQYLVRILFCLFADDTGIFPRNGFTFFIENTRIDGVDVGQVLEQIFQVLNTPEDERQKNLDELMAALPYVNGGLFKEPLPMANFNSHMRAELLKCCHFDWSEISPAIFGSLFQSVMDGPERRQIGAHYTSERDILKVVKSLFLDELRGEFRKLQGDRSKQKESRLRKFHERLGNLNFLDPACGCGNFLVITYRELRLLEIDVLSELYGSEDQLRTDIHLLSLIDVDAMYGIEIEEFPARIAEVALWLMDHQMNTKLSEVFGQYYVRLPLKKSAKIVHGNALRIDWNDVIPVADCSFVLGNPPFIGKHLMTDGQKADIEHIWGRGNGSGVLDYVSCWYRCSVSYIKNTQIPVAFVSTNSITQGEQASIMWNDLFSHGLHIHFAHRTFSWISEARGKAHVHVVIIGFGLFEVDGKTIYDYEITDEGTALPAKNISPYLIEGKDEAVESISKPLCDVPPCGYGSKPTDKQNLIIEEEDREEFLSENPLIKPYVRPLLCAEEYLYNIPRWCLWLVDCPPAVIKQCPGVMKRIEGVRRARLASSKVPTQRLADKPTLFAEIRQPNERFVVIPQHTSENRKYIPFGYFDPTFILHNSCSAIMGASLYHFGVISSIMHMAWVKTVCGRLESRYRYSTRLVYNNYPWPQEVTRAKREKIEVIAKRLLDVRTKFADSTLADLYDPLTMPEELLDAHKALDKAVDLAYRTARFNSELERVQFMFDRYREIKSPLI